MEKVVYKLESGKTLTFRKPEESFKVEKYLINNSSNIDINSKKKYYNT